MIVKKNPTHQDKFLEQPLYVLPKLWGETVAIRPPMKVLPLFSQLKGIKTTVQQFSQRRIEQKYAVLHWFFQSVSCAGLDQLVPSDCGPLKIASCG